MSCLGFHSLTAAATVSKTLSHAPDGPLALAVDEREYTGAEMRLHGRLFGRDDARLTVTLNSHEAPDQIEDFLHLTLQSDSLLLFDPETEQTLRTDHGPTVPC